MKKEINLLTEKKLKEATELDHELFEKIKENRPYFSMEELKKVPEIDKETYEELKENFWCL